MGLLSWLKALTCLEYELLPLARRRTRQTIRLLRKELWLDGCLGVEPRQMESLWMNVSADWVGNHFGWGHPWSGERVPLFNYTLAYALQLRSTEYLSQDSRLALLFISMGWDYVPELHCSSNNDMSMESHGGIILTGENWRTLKNLSLCHFVHHKSNTEWHGSEPGYPRWEADY
jgi:hypothetical protein